MEWRRAPAVRFGLPYLLFSLVVTGMTGMTGGEVCLPEGIPEAKRSYVLNATNQQSAIQILSFDWRLPVAISLVTEIIISEVLGYHVAVEEKGIYWFGAIESFGCSSTDCETQHGKTDIVLDVWLSEVAQFFADFQSANRQVVEDLGSMGYEGSESMYVKGSVQEHAEADSGLPLEYYKSYNLSFNKPYTYFDTIWDLNTSEVSACTTQGSDFMNPSKMKNFLDWTGDVEGVMETNGEYSAYCPVPTFWIAPSCRHNYTLCIPSLAHESSLGVQMHRSVALGIPLALAAPLDEGLGTVHEQLIRKHRILYEWYSPEDSFLDLKPSRLILPEHRPEAWAKGDYRTDSVKVYIAKLGSPRLRISAPRVRAFVQKMKLSEEQALQVMSFRTNKFQPWIEAQEGACEWVKANRDIWKTWIPLATDCTAGFGLADLEGMPVRSRAEAVSCEICSAGHFSELYEDAGLTYRCQPCDPGYHQARAGQPNCVPCDPGTYTNESGQASCSPCGRGSFMNLSAATSCFPCGPSEAWTTSRAVVEGGQERWIELEGAISEDLCRCVQGWYLSGNQCEFCAEGASCPGSGALQVLPGFHSSASDPGRLMKCFGNPLRCPGGLPGTCSAGRDPDSIACSSCLSGLQPTAQECVPCTGGDYLAISLLAGLGLLLTGALHILLTMDRMKGSYFDRLLGAALCVSQLITCAQLFSVIEQIQGITWKEPFLSFLQFFGILSLQTLVESVKTVGCVARITSEMEFLIRTLLVPLLFTIGPVFAHLVMVKLHLAQGSGGLVKTFGFLMQLFFISLCSSFVEPFRCNVHPNGLLTMQTAHDVFCNFSDTHLTLCWMSGLICLLPLTFLVLCTWVLLVVLPGKTQAADALFVRACSFLILRFKPGYGGFTIAFLMRNLLFVLGPTMQAASLLVMGSLLAAVGVSVAYLKPWRLELSTQVDVLMNWVLLVVLLAGAMTFDDFTASETDGLMILCTVCGCCLTFAILFAAMYSVVKHIASNFRKKYAFFLSHQKSASSGFARLLKMELKRCGSGYTSFIDADDLTDLSRLFFYVTNDTQTFVLIATPQILERKWCAGELTMAKLAGVDTLLVKFPDFAFPDEDFIRTYKVLVPDISDLVQLGIGIWEVQETFRWLQTVQSYDVGSKLSKQSLAGVVNYLTKEASLVPEGLVTDYTILADPDNPEAVATAHVLGRFMAATIPEKGLSPLVLDVDDDVSRSNSQLILLCTQHCFQSRHIARWMLQARMVPTCQLLPVIGDENFQIAKVYQELSSPLSDLPVDRHAYSIVIKATFLELAIPFICSQASEHDLAIRSRQVVARLFGNLKRLNTKLLIVNGSSIDVQGPSEPQELAPEGDGDDGNSLDMSFQDILESETISRTF